MQNSTFQNTIFNWNHTNILLQLLQSQYLILIEWCTGSLCRTWCSCNVRENDTSKFASSSKFAQKAAIFEKIQISKGNFSKRGKEIKKYLNLYRQHTWGSWQINKPTLNEKRFRRHCWIWYVLKSDNQTDILLELWENKGECDLMGKAAALWITNPAFWAHPPTRVANYNLSVSVLFFFANLGSSLERTANFGALKNNVNIVNNITSTVSRQTDR